MGFPLLLNIRRGIRSINFRHVLYLLVFLLLVDYVRIQQSKLSGFSWKSNINAQSPSPTINQKNQNPIKAEVKKPINNVVVENFNHVSYKIVKVFNQIGGEAERTNFNVFAAILELSDIDEKTKTSILSKMTPVHKSIDSRRHSNPNSKTETQIAGAHSVFNKTQIVVATIACGGRHEEAMVMLKSAAMFSQDASLHAVIFSDDDSMQNVAQEILELKWTVNALGWDFTFELHHDSFPVANKAEWKDMYRKCATQRLFFPSILSHIDSIIYLDTDLVVVSNLTEFWEHFAKYMKSDRMVAVAPNNEPTSGGWYTDLKGNKKIPFYGPSGINAGIMLMNLTQMRQFNFEDKAVAVYNSYKENIQLADQDIVNILFAAYPERLHSIDCSYNFYWIHCGNNKLHCYNKTTGENFCFCKPILEKGTRIVHGNWGTFFNQFGNYFRQAFLPPFYQAFKKLDLLKDSYTTLFQDLRKQFNSLNPSPCDPLTADLLYRNAEAYLQKLNPKSPKTSLKSS